MTTTQKEVMEQVRDLLRDHFDVFVIGIGYDADHVDGLEREGKGVVWHGSSLHVLGCAEYVKQTLLKRCYKDDPKE